MYGLAFARQSFSLRRICLRRQGPMSSKKRQCTITWPAAVMSAWKPSLEIFNNLSNSGRPIIDRTGLAGTFDFILEWTPSPGDAYTVGPANSEFEGVTFPEAVKEQLGMKLESTK